MPPFCTLGKTFYENTFDILPSLSVNNANVTSIISSGKLTWTTSGAGDDISNTLCTTTGNNFQAYFIGVYLNDAGRCGIKLGSNTSSIIRQTNNINVSGIALTPYVPGASFSVKIGPNLTDRAYYYNGVFIGTEVLPGSNNIQIQWGGSSSSGNIEYFYVEGDGLSTPCQGEIPTAHREIVSSSAKISHSRILQEHRTAPEAQRFHDWMKNAT